MTGLPHWLNVELWGPLWPNMVAPSVWTITAIVISHVKHARRADRHHQALKDHIANTTGGTQ